MTAEKRIYRIKGFRDDGNKIRVLLAPESTVDLKKKINVAEVMKDPMGFAQRLMSQEAAKIINDSFSISREEYLDKRYMVGEIVTVTISRE